MEEHKQQPETTQQAKKGNGFIDKLKSPRVIETAIGVAAIIGIAGAAYYFLVLQNRIFTDKAQVSAPLIDLGVESPGILKNILVKNGDLVKIGEPVARIDNGYITANTNGMVVSTNDEVGKLFTPEEAVVTMINPDDLRVVAQVGENAGLRDIQVGQKADFTVDAFGSKKFSGVVEEIGKTAFESSLAFSISDKREEKEFAIKIKYDVGEYPELLNGMSARVWIYKK